MEDNRIRYTKMIIRNSFMQLLKDKPIEKISVTSICKLSEINRATFYRYYDNQYDLLSAIQNEMFEKIKKSLYEKLQDVDSVTKLILVLFYENKEEWVLLLSDNADSRFGKKLYNFFNDYFEYEKLSDEGKMRYQFMLYGYSGLFESWIKNGMNEPPEKIAKYLIKFRHDLIQNV